MTTPSTSRPLFPFELVRPYLDSNNLIKNMRIESKLVYAALLDIFKYRKIVQNATNSRKSKETSTPPNCTECFQGYISIDTKEGCFVCNRCGAIVESLLTGADTSNRDGDNPENTKYIPGVSQGTMKKVSRGTYHEKCVLSFREDLDHWNQFVQISTGGIDGLVHLLENWQDGVNHSRCARVAAALLYTEIEGQIPTENIIRGRIQRGAPLVPVVYTRPSPTFECPSCRHLLFDVKSAKYHCRLVFGKKRKRSKN